jgi:hypothetical protein
MLVNEKKRKPAGGIRGQGKITKELRRGLDFFDETGFNRLHGDENALGAAVGGFNSDSLEVGTEFAGRDGRDVRADASAFFRLTFAVDAAAFDGAFACDCADSSHDWM